MDRDKIEQARAMLTMPDLGVLVFRGTEVELSACRTTGAVTLRVGDAVIVLSLGQARQLQQAVDLCVNASTTVTSLNHAGIATVLSDNDVEVEFGAKLN